MFSTPRPYSHKIRTQAYTYELSLNIMSVLCYMTQHPFRSRH